MARDDSNERSTETLETFELDVEIITIGLNYRYSLYDIDF